MIRGSMRAPLPKKKKELIHSLFFVYVALPGAIDFPGGTATTGWLDWAQLGECRAPGSRTRRRPRRRTQAAVTQ